MIPFLLQALTVPTRKPRASGDDPLSPAGPVTWYV